MPSKADKSRAQRIRKKLRDKKPVSSADRAFLAKYAPPSSGPRRGRPPKPIPGEDPPPRPPKLAGPTRELRPIARDVVEEKPAQADDDDEPDDDDDEPAHDGEVVSEKEAPRPKCTIKDCPRCAGKNALGYEVCKATGEKVWEPMKMRGARALAGIIFFVIGWAVKTAYKHPEIIDPTPLEMTDLAESLIEIAQRRAGYLAAFDDLLGGAYSTGAYWTRAKRNKQLPADATTT